MEIVYSSDLRKLFSQSAHSKQISFEAIKLLLETLPSTRILFKATSNDYTNSVYVPMSLSDLSKEYLYSFGTYTCLWGEQRNDRGPKLTSFIVLETRLLTATDKLTILTGDSQHTADENAARLRSIENDRERDRLYDQRVARDLAEKRRTSERSIEAAYNQFCWKNN